MKKSRVKMDLREKVQDFVDHVCEREGWEAPRVEIPSWEEWLGIAVQHTDGHVPSEEVFGWPDILRERIYVSPRHVNRTTVLHELYHYNATGKPNEIIDRWIGRIMKDPDLFSAARGLLELQAEAEARRLSRKYADEWKRSIHT